MTLRVRFVAITTGLDTEPIIYSIQRLTLFGWIYMRGCSEKGFPFGNTISHDFVCTSKQSLLTNVINCHYKNKKNIEIVEYPTILKYTIKK